MTPTLRRWLSRFELLQILVLALCVRGYWSQTIPFNGGPDEFVHAQIIRYLHEHHQPPTLRDVPNPIATSLAVLPPAGYLPSVVASHFVGLEHPDWHLWVRWSQVIVGTATVFVGYQIARVMGCTHYASLMVAAGLAFHPSLVFVNSYLNNDTTAILLAHLVVSLVLRLSALHPCTTAIATRVNSSQPMPAGSGLTRFAGTDGRAWLIVGIMIGLASLAKPNTIVLSLMLPICLGWRIWDRRKTNSRRIWRRECLLVIAGLLFNTAPWMWWGWTQHRSLTGLDVHLAWWKNFVRQQPAVDQQPLGWSNAWFFATETWRSYWATFGYGEIRLKSAWYRAITLAFGLLASLGLLLRFVDRFAQRQARLPDSARSHHVSFDMQPHRSTLTGVLLLVVFSAGLLGFHLMHAFTVVAAPAGRYLLPSVVLVHLLVAMGITRLADRLPRHQWITTVLLLGWPTLLAFTWFSADRAMQQAYQIKQASPYVNAHIIAYRTTWPSAAGRSEWPGDNSRPSTNHNTQRMQSAREPFVAEQSTALRTRWIDLTELNSNRQLVLDLERIAGPVDQAALQLTFIEPNPPSRRLDLPSDKMPGADQIAERATRMATFPLVFPSGGVTRFIIPTESMLNSVRANESILSHVQIRLLLNDANYRVRIWRCELVE